MNKVRHLFKGSLCRGETWAKTAWQCLMNVWCPGDSEEMTFKRREMLNFSGTGTSISQAIWQLSPYTLIGSNLFPSVWKAWCPSKHWSDSWLCACKMSAFWAVCVLLPRGICFTRCLTSGSIGMPALLLHVYLQHICCCANAKQQSKW